jgi:hypothetical protein
MTAPMALQGPFTQRYFADLIRWLTLLDRVNAVLELSLIHTENKYPLLSSA